MSFQTSHFLYYVVDLAQFFLHIFIEQGNTVQVIIFVKTILHIPFAV